MKVFIKIILFLFVAMIVLAVAVSGGNEKPNEAMIEQEQSNEVTVETEQDNSERDMIWNFLIEKGYEVKTVMGVPMIDKVEGGYQVRTVDGKDYAVVLFNGEVSAITPIK